MKKKRIPVRFTGQHFINDNKLIHKMIRDADIQSTDLVLDIGAGTGNITIKLANLGCEIIAIENDSNLVTELRRRVNYFKNVTIFEGDILDFDFPSEDFKVVSNIPFALTSSIMQKVMYDSIDSFKGGCLILQKESAYKYSAKCFHQPKRLFYRIFFNIEIIKILKPFNFSPPPKIDCALLRIRERSVSKDWLKWKESLIIFLNRVLSKPEARLEKLLRKLFRKHQIEYILTKYNIPNEQKAKDVPIKYWESIFHEWCRYKKMN